MRNPAHTSTINAFFSALPVIDKKSPNAVFSYIAVKKEGRFVLLAGKVTFNVEHERHLPPEISTTSVLAGRLFLNDLGLTPRRMITQLFKGSLKIPGVTLDFPPDNPGQYSVFPIPPDTIGYGERRRRHELQIGGAQRDKVVDYSDLEWALTGAPGHFGGLEQLMAAYGMKPCFGSVVVWFIAAEIVEVDKSASVIRGKKATVALTLRPGFDPKLVSLGVRIFVQDQPEKTRSLANSQLHWNRKDAVDRAIADFEIPRNANVDCIAIYDDVAQHSTRLTSKARMGARVDPVFGASEPGPPLAAVNRIIMAQPNMMGLGINLNAIVDMGLRWIGRGSSNKTTS